MIVYKDKMYVTRIDIPDENWTDDLDVFVIHDESEIAQKIMRYVPFYEFVLDGAGNLIDVTPSKPLGVAKQEKIAELDKACKQAILGYFVADVDGFEYTFSNDVEAQSNFKDGMWALESGRIASVKWTAHDSTGTIVRLNLDLQKLSNVNVARLTHQMTTIAKFRDTLQPQVEAINVTETVSEQEARDQIASIVW